jgi:uncharacterized protein (DUF1684 family)
MKQFKSLRRQKDIFFARDHQSPLMPSQKQGFKGLSYFPEAPDLRF